MEHLLAVAGAIALICSCLTGVILLIHWIYRAVTAGKGYITKDVKELEGKVVEMSEKCDEHCEHVDDCLDRDLKRLNQQDVAINLLLRGMLQLMTHELDGNHVDKLEAARDDIQNYLIER